MQFLRVAVAVLAPVAVIAAVASVAATLLSAPRSGRPLHVSVVSTPKGIVTHAACRLSPTRHSVVATGQLAKGLDRGLGWDNLSLAVYDHRTTLLNARGVMESTNANEKYTPHRSWRIRAKVVSGYVPARCVLDVATPISGIMTLYLPTWTMYPTAARGLHGFEMDTEAYLLGRPERGDIVVMRRRAVGDRCPVGWQFTSTVARIIGLPGEEVSARHGRVYITSKPLPEPWLSSGSSSYTAAFGPVRVPSGDYFVLGDNRPAGCDSRMFGPVPLSSMRGKVVSIVAEPKQPAQTAPVPAS